MDLKQLNSYLGNIDLYVLDHLLKGNFAINQPLLDAGCGEGRNLRLFLALNYTVYGIDQNVSALRMLSYTVRKMRPDLDPGRHFLQGQLSDLPFASGFFGSLLCCDVLHFSPDKKSFEQFVIELFRVLQPGGCFLLIMDSNLHSHKKPNKKGDLSMMPSGDLRYAFDEEDYTFIRKHAEPLEPPVHISQKGLKNKISLMMKKKP